MTSPYGYGNQHFSSKKVTGSSVHVDAISIYKCEGGFFFLLFTKMPRAPFYIEALL